MLDYNPSFWKTDTTDLFYDVFGWTNEKARFFFYTHVRHLHRTERGFVIIVGPPFPYRAQGLTKTGLVLLHVRVKAASRARPTYSIKLNQTKSTPTVHSHKPPVSQLVKAIPCTFMEPSGSLPCSQQPATCNYPQPDQLSARPLNRLDSF